MKKILGFTAILPGSAIITAAFSGCNEDDDEKATQRIRGAWEMVQYERYERDGSWEREWFGPAWGEYEEWTFDNRGRGTIYWEEYPRYSWEDFRWSIYDHYLYITIGATQYIYDIITLNHTTLIIEDHYKNGLIESYTRYVFKAFL